MCKVSRPATRLTYQSDPFLKMIETNKTYGFTIAVKELRETVPNIFRYASAYKRVNNLESKGLWEMFIEPLDDPQEVHDETDGRLPEEILKNDPTQDALPVVDGEAMEGEKYNMCHFWSNFEIARLSWFRSQEYEDFFQMMDRSGGFWMERVFSFSLRTVIGLTYFSGVTHQFTPWPPVPFSHHEISITSETLVTDIQPSSIVPLTLPLVNVPVSHSLKRRR